jgi:putative transposase
MALLTTDSWRRLLSESIDRAVARHQFRTVAFVYMPEHVHLLVDPVVSDSRVDRLLYAIKRPFSYRIKQQLEQTANPLIEQLTVRERPGKQVFRFWQEGPGYDRNLKSSAVVLKAIDYIHNNPVRRGLCRDPEGWRWSSWKHYHRPEELRDPDLPQIDGLVGA